MAAEDGARTEKADAGDDGADDPVWIGADQWSQFAGAKVRYQHIAQSHKQSRCPGYQHMRAEAGRSVGGFALKADQSAQQHGQRHFSNDLKL